MRRSHQKQALFIIAVIGLVGSMTRLADSEPMRSAQPGASSAETELAPIGPKRNKPRLTEPQWVPLGPPLGIHRLTFYWMASESRSEARQESLYTQDCKAIASVSSGFATKLRLEGSGRLRDGRVINVAGNCRCQKPCFQVLPASRRWGAGARGPLSPFRSVAADAKVHPLGTILYIPDLDGARMPGYRPWGGFVHDGCVIVDDRGGGVRGKQLDFYAARKGFYRWLRKKYKLKRVRVLSGRGRCKRSGRSVLGIAGPATSMKT